MDDAGKAEQLLRNLARRLEKDWEGVAASILTWGVSGQGVRFTRA
jgi:hypothetical protein